MSKPIVYFPCSVQRLNNGNTLITDAGNELGSGSKIVEINLLGDTVWSYEKDLFFAHSAERQVDGSTLITDTGNNRLLLISYKGYLELDSSEWSSSTGRMSDGSKLNYPNDAHQINDGVYLITDRNNDRAIFVNKFLTKRLKKVRKMRRYFRQSKTLTLMRCRSMTRSRIELSFFFVGKAKSRPFHFLTK